MAGGHRWALSALLLLLLSASTAANAAASNLLDRLHHRPSRPEAPTCPDGRAARCGAISTMCCAGPECGKTLTTTDSFSRGSLDWSELGKRCSGSGSLAATTHGFIYISEGEDDLFDFAISVNSGSAAVTLDGTKLLDSADGAKNASAWLKSGYHYCEVQFDGAAAGSSASVDLKWKGKNSDGSGSSAWSYFPKRKWCHCDAAPAPVPEPARPAPPPPSAVLVPECWDGSAPMCGYRITYCFKGYAFALLSNIFGNFDKCLPEWGGSFNWLQGSGLSGVCGYSRFVGLGARWEGYLLVDEGDEADFEFSVDVRSGSAALSLDGDVVLHSAKGITSNTHPLKAGYNKATMKFSSAGSDSASGCQYEWRKGSGGRHTIPVKNWCQCPQRPAAWGEV